MIGGELHFISFDVKENKYKVISISTFREALTKDVRGINRDAFQSFLLLPNWQKVIKENFGENAISGVGVYIENNPRTQLFEGENAKAKDFFIQEYKKTVDYQQRLLNEQSDKLHGNFNDLFPSLKNHPKITPEIQELIKGKKIAEAYNKLAVSGATNGDIKQIMDSIEKDAKSLKEKGLVEIRRQEDQFKGKRWSEFKNDFDLKNENDRKEFEKLHSQLILPVTPERRAFLILRVDKASDIGKYIVALSNTINAANTQGQAHSGGMEAGRHPRIAKATPLTPRGTEIFQVSGQSLGIFNESQILTRQAEKYIAGMQELTTIEARQKKLNELEVRGLSDLSQKEKDLLDALRTWNNTKEKVAVSIDNLRQNTSREEAASFVRATFGLELSKEESLRYIDRQTFVAKYVAEKNFVDTVEKNAAYMNTGDKKTVQELYNEKGQVDVSRMTGATGSINLGETNLITHNTFAGMNELMQCQVTMGTSGNLTRNILAKDGITIIVKDIPVDNLDTTISQLGRFYAIGLGILAPFMQHINTAIKSGRTDSVRGTDGTFDLVEDKKFLEIMARLLYAEEDIPEEKNIPNLIRVFQSVDPEKNPIKKLRDANIIDESKQINTTVLGEKISAASSKVL